MQKDISSSGEPEVFEATLTFADGRETPVAVPVLWSVDGVIIPDFDPDQADDVMGLLSASAVKMFDISVHLDVAPNVTALARMNADYELVANPAALVEWLNGPASTLH